MSNKIIRRGFLAVALAVAAASAQADVFNMPSGDTSLQFVTVGNPGNAPDPATGGLYGAVSYTYQMGTYDVTLAQYTAFLNAVAKTDTYGLYNSAMDSDYAPMEGISQSGTPGSYSYSVTGSAPGAANMPVFNVTWGDAARFCNWLQNGQPTGAEGNGTTETGAYTLSGDTTTYLETRNPGATYVIPSENEWYKAAYYNPSSGIYWTYPTQSNAAPNNSLALAGSTPNEANYLIGTTYTDPTNHLTPVGTFSDSPGPFGTYDMGGNVWQWNEAIILTSRGLRGGVWGSYDTYLASSGRNRGGPQNVADIDVSFIGFRVAKVPAPGGIIAQWNMDTLGTQAAPYNSPAATTNNTQDKNGAGAPVATALGMQNDYAFIDSGTTVAVGSVTDCDILSTTGNTAAGGSGKTAYAWRIRGPGTNGYNPATGTPTGTGNGWSNSAPQYSQGVQFNADTTGYSNIAVAFNYYCTSQGIRDLQFQYTINGSTWVSFGPTLISVPGDWYSSSGIVEDLSGIPGVNNDPNFGVRMVSAYDSTGNLGDNYASATLASGLTQPYNDYSGNWRFGTVTIETMPPSNPVWASAGPGNWSDSTKWTGSVPNAVGAVAVFDVLDHRRGDRHPEHTGDARHTAVGQLRQHERGLYAERQRQKHVDLEQFRQRCDDRSRQRHTRHRCAGAPGLEPRRDVDRLEPLVAELRYRRQHRAERYRQLLVDHERQRRHIALKRQQYLQRRYHDQRRHAGGDQPGEPGSCKRQPVDRTRHVGSDQRILVHAEYRLDRPTGDHPGRSLGHVQQCWRDLRHGRTQQDRRRRVGAEQQRHLQWRDGGRGRDPGGDQHQRPAHRNELDRRRARHVGLRSLSSRGLGSRCSCGGP